MGDPGIKIYSKIVTYINTAITYSYMYFGVAVFDVGTENMSFGTENHVLAHLIFLDDPGTLRPAIRVSLA